MTDNILIVDDEADIRHLIEGILQDEGYQTQSVGDDESALKALRDQRPAAVILDIWLQGSKRDGMELLDQFKREYPNLPVIMISGHGTIDVAVTAIQKGAEDFIEKPFKADRLLLRVARALETSRLRRENEELKLNQARDLELIGVSSSIQHLQQTVEKIAPTGSRVLLNGAPGSGKEFLARMIHEKSLRSTKPFVIVNCSGVSSPQLDVDLFGTEPRLVDGKAMTRVIGAFEKAEGGTLLLDAVCEMPMESQNKLVKVLQNQSFKRMGGEEYLKADVRILASSARDLKQLIADGKFHQDLFYRLNVLTLDVPSLMQRREDIEPLIRRFMDKLARRAGRKAPRVNDEAMAVLQSYAWPGNVRQLKNVVEWLFIMAHDKNIHDIGPDVLPPEISSTTSEVLRWDSSGKILSLGLRDAREIFEREYLLAQVMRHNGNISKTASFVGMERSALHRKLRSLGVQSDDYKDNGFEDIEEEDIKAAG